MWCGVFYLFTPRSICDRPRLSTLALSVSAHAVSVLLAALVYWVDPPVPFPRFARLVALAGATADEGRRVSSRPAASRFVQASVAEPAPEPVQPVLEPQSATSLPPEDSAGAPESSGQDGHDGQPESEPEIPLEIPDVVERALPPPLSASLDSAPHLVIGGRVEAAIPLVHDPPVYPERALRERIEGTVIIEARILPEGYLDKLRVIDGHPLLVIAAIQCVKRWRYIPVKLNGQAIPANTVITINFKLAGPR